MRRVATGLVMTLLGGSFLTAQDSEEDSRFERLKKLAGDWTMEGENKVAVRYRVTSGGSAVLETVFPDTPKEMITMYTLDGDDLKLTHYCMLGNQPTMRAGKMEKGAFHFQCDGKVPNTRSHDDLHMHSLVMTFVDDDHLHNDWTLLEGGKEQERYEMVLVRKK